MNHNIKTKYQRIKDELQITDEHIAEFFGYKNAGSLRSAARADKIRRGVVLLYEQIIKIRPCYDPTAEVSKNQPATLTVQNKN